MNTDEQNEYVRRNFHKKRRTISKKERKEIAEKTNNKCGYCGCNLPKRWHVNHIDAFARNGSSCKEENLMASCPQCNRFKSTFSIEQFRRELKFQVSRAREYSVNFRFAEKFQQIEVTEKPIVFYFEEIGLRHNRYYR